MENFQCPSGGIGIFTTITNNKLSTKITRKQNIDIRNTKSLRSS